MAVAIYLLVFYLVKGVVLDVKGRDKGELIAHILLLKTPVLMLYPTYAELLDYCSGFMLADMPWLNNLFARVLADPRDASPSPYLLFYTSLNIASTYFLPLLFIILCYIVLLVVNKLIKDKTETLTNIGLVIYNYFLGGLSLATAACIQGSFLNPM